MTVAVAPLLPPPAPPASAELDEVTLRRAQRGDAGLGDEAERLLAEKLGADRAHGLRVQQGGWPMRMDMAGCVDDDGNATGGAPYPP